MKFENKLIKFIDIKDIGQCARKSWYSFNHCLPVFNAGSFIDIKSAILAQLESQCDRLLTISPKTGKPLDVLSADGYYGGTIDAVMVKGGKPFIVSVEMGAELTPQMELSLHAQLSLSYQVGKKINDGVIFLITPNGVTTHKLSEDWTAVEVVNSKSELRAREGVDECNSCNYSELCTDAAPIPSCRNCGHCALDVCAKGHQLTPCVDHLFNPDFLEHLTAPVNFHQQDHVLEYEKFYNGTQPMKQKYNDKPVLTSLEIYKIFSSKHDDQIADLLSFVGKFGATVRNVGSV